MLEYVTVPEAVVAITGVTLLDGTGAPARAWQTVVLADGRIQAVAADGQMQIPAGARTIDGSGHTLIPGIVGLHDHLYYTAAGGRSAQLTYTGPRLYLGTGVTTVRTEGSRTPYLEINQRAEIDAGRQPGPRIHITAPYITGGGGALPGYGDQRNYELLREAGFTPEEMVRIMTLNRAIVLGEDVELGSVEPGKIADLVLLEGDLTREGAVINRTVTVFKNGVGDDSARLLADVRGRLGIH